MLDSTVHIFLVAYVITGATCVLVVSVESMILVQLPAEMAVFPCTFQRQNKNALFNILWVFKKRQGERVLQRDSSGEIFKGKFFSHAEYPGDGCTLILRKPSPEDSGGYVVNVFVDGEGRGEADVELIVIMSENTTVPVTATKEMPKLNDNIEPLRTSANGDTENIAGDKNVLITCISAIIIALGAPVAFLCVIIRSRRERKLKQSSPSERVTHEVLLELSHEKENGESAMDSVHGNGDAKQLLTLGANP